MDTLFAEIEALATTEVFGRVAGVRGLMVEVAGPLHLMGVGARLAIEIRGGTAVPVEVVGFEEDRALCLPFGALDGVRMGCRAVLVGADAVARPTQAWLGRVVNAHGEAIDGKGTLARGTSAMHLRSSPPPAAERGRVGAPIDVGVRALNTFVTCCEGQRMGIFAGSGVGKSVLLSMLARYTACDVAVIGLVGERGARGAGVHRG